MTTLTKPQNTDTENQKVLDRLARVVRRADNFVLGFVKCNHLPQQDEMRQALLSRLADTRVLEILLDAPIVSLLDEITAGWDADNPPDVVCVYGLRHSIRDEASPVLGRLNNDRELIRRAIPVPLLIWLPDFAIDLIARGAPDFWAWRSGVYEFQTDVLLWGLDSLIASTFYASTMSSLNATEKQSAIGRLEELIRTAQNLRNTGKREQAILSHLFFQAGSLHCDLNEWDKAEMSFELALKIDRGLPHPAGVAAALGNLGNIAYTRGNHEAAQEFFEESLTISQERGERVNVAVAKGSLGNIYAARGDIETARALFEESMAISQDLGDKAGVADSLVRLGNISSALGDAMTARTLFEDSLAIGRKIEDRARVVNSLMNQGIAASAHGDHKAAKALFEESLKVSREIGNKIGVAHALLHLGVVQGNQGKALEALPELLGAWQVFQDLHLADCVSLSRRNIQTARRQLGEEQFQAWLREKCGKKEAHRLTRVLDEATAEVAAAA